MTPGVDEKSPQVSEMIDLSCFIERDITHFEEEKTIIKKHSDLDFFSMEILF